MSHTSHSNRNNGKRPREEALPEFKLTINSQDERSFTFVFNPEHSLRKLFKIYCKKRNLERSTLQFIYEGDPIDSKRTPAELGMLNGDIIDALSHQSGGGCSI